MKLVVKEHQIEKEITVCPYCMNEVSERYYGGCCGESSAHFETAYVIEGHDEYYLASEVEIEEYTAEERADQKAESQLDDWKEGLYD